MPKQPPRLPYKILKKLEGIGSLNKEAYAALGLDKALHTPMDVYNKLLEKHGVNAASMLKTRKKLGIDVRAHAKGARVYASEHMYRSPEELYSHHHAAQNVMEVDVRDWPNSNDPAFSVLYNEYYSEIFKVGYRLHVSCVNA